MYMEFPMQLIRTQFAWSILGKGFPMQVTRLLEWVYIYIYVHICDNHGFGERSPPRTIHEVNRLSISIQSVVDCI